MSVNCGRLALGKYIVLSRDHKFDQIAVFMQRKSVLIFLLCIITASDIRRVYCATFILLVDHLVDYYKSCDTFPVAMVTGIDLQDEECAAILKRVSSTLSLCTIHRYVHIYTVHMYMHIYVLYIVCTYIRTYYICSTDVFPYIEQYILHYTLYP